MLLFCCILVFTIIHRADSLCRNGEECVYEDVFAQYNTLTRPVRNSSASVNVKVKFTLESLIEIEETNEIMKVVGFVSALWTDEFLKWDPDQYEGVEQLILPAQKVWLPDIFIKNSVDGYYQKTFKEDFMVTVAHNGTVHWEFGGIFQTCCDLHVADYPFDSQTCNVELGFWWYTTSHLSLEVVGSELAETYMEDPIWILKHMDYKQDFGNKPTLSFSFTWKRKPLYYMVHILIPTCFIMVIALGVFWLPPDSGEKASVGITVLLAFSFFQIIIANSTPAHSDDIPLVSELVTMVMTMSTISVLGAILSISLALRDTEIRVPKIIRNVAFSGLARLFCMRCHAPKHEPRRKQIKHNGSFTSDITELKHLLSDTESQNYPTTAQIRAVLAILEELKSITGRTELKERNQFVVAEWKFLAIILDRLLFWLCIVVLIIAVPSIFA